MVLLWLWLYHLVHGRPPLYQHSYFLCEYFRKDLKMLHIDIRSHPDAEIVPKEL